MVELNQGLRETLFERPGDEAPWLILGDWLLERGDPAYEYYHCPYWANSLSMRFALVPRGRFWMSEGDRNAQREVEIPYDFYVGVHQVTQGQWRAVMGANPSYFGREGNGRNRVANVSDPLLDSFPVENVSWDDVRDFVGRLNRRSRKWEYRLPTEIEWEYACREARQTREECEYDFYLHSGPSNSLASTEANFNGIERSEPYLDRPCPVGSYPANRLGLYDMHGNVWEWCQDPFVPFRGACSAAGAGPTTAGSAGPRPATGSCRSSGTSPAGAAWPQDGGDKSPGRVLRGGSWTFGDRCCRSAHRSWYVPGFRFQDSGLRLAATRRG